MSSVGQNQILLPYLLLADRGAFEVIQGTVLGKMTTGGSLTKADVMAAIDALRAARGLKPWSAALRKRWAEGLLSVLREVTALGTGSEREMFVAYSVRPEAFSFHLWGLYSAGLRGRALHESAFWRFLLLSADEVRPHVQRVAEARWWRLTNVGGVDEIRPAYASALEWIEHGLG
jgi:hypothetical protein